MTTTNSLCHNRNTLSITATTTTIAKLQTEKKQKHKDLACNTTIFMLNLMRWSLKMQHIRKRQQKSIDYFCVYVYVFICYTLKATINCFMLKTFNAFQYCNTVLFSSFKSPIFTYIYTWQSQIFVWSTNKQNDKEKNVERRLIMSDCCMFVSHFAKFTWFVVLWLVLYL